MPHEIIDSYGNNHPHYTSARALNGYVMATFYCGMNISIYHTFDCDEAMSR